MKTKLSAVLEQRWGFLSSWCEVLEARVRYVWAGREEEVWDVPKRRLEVKLPTRHEISQSLWAKSKALFSTDEDFQTCFHKVREALALLAAVAHVDQDGWRYLLKIHCGVVLGTEGEEVFDEEIPARFMLYLIEDNDHNGYKEYAKTLQNDIVKFCGVYQREHPSRAYLKALKRIAAMDSNLKTGKPGLDLKIPVQVGFRVMDFISYDALKEILEPLQDIREAKKIIKKEWKVYEQSQKTKVMENGSLRCTFVLGPLIADFHDMDISAEMVKVMDTMIRDNVRFSQMNLWAFVGRELEDKEHEKRVVISQIMASIFDSTRRLPDTERVDGDCGAVQLNFDPDPLQLGTIHLECTSLMGTRDFESMCTAIAVSQTTRKLSLQLEVDPHDGTSVHWWKWLAYSLFSKRATAFSAVESLAFISTRSMSVVDIEAFSTVLASDHPEEELFGCIPGLIEARDATAKAGTSFYWELTNRGHARRNSRAVTCQSSLYPVRTFSDDGKSEWVNVLVPGYGHCYVRRADLTFDEATTLERPCSVTELRIGFDISEPSVSDGLSRFLAVIGSSLKRLTLNTSSFELNGNAVLQNCPNLEELSLCGGEMMDMKLDFSSFRASNEAIPELVFEWDTVSALANELSNQNNPLSKCLRRLRVFLTDERPPWGIIGAVRSNRPTFEADLSALLNMLDVNKTLEYLDVVVPFGHFLYLNDFRAHHLKPIDRSLKLPAETKVAFLSVFLSRENPAERKKFKRRTTRGMQLMRPICQLDQHVMSKILAFTAPRVLRKVYLHGPPRNNFEEPDQIPI
ncbi:hypothetical protein F441_02983 [Phytophthora nicotianae CJ01A1]|uniref:Uncharacterized protein n=1 Tax=Phytophthora nicotianae CJ01A1 TaxID=1317063 RepID=W2XNH9_PHYNI|nr:hypothetical protein F441_02983 [Phytophthora nicotianae CJ01A1]